MESIPLPEKIESKKIDKNKSEIIIEPLYPGYGTTVGNALRRVLLSSLPGAAIVAVKISGVQHEFSTIEKVKEDVVDILLNLKMVNIKYQGTEDVKLQLNASGEKKVTAADIKKTAGVEITNPTCPIATLTDKSAKLEMELTVNTGRGYIPVEQREKEKLEIGNIAIDSIYTPVKMVNFEIENVRVGQMTNYNRLVISIETDGTITPEEAFDQAASVLVDHFSFVLTKGEVKKEKTSKKPAKQVKDDEAVSDEKEAKEDKDEKKEAKEDAKTDKDDNKEKVEKVEKKKRGRPKKESK
ncbi:DNA-directed RNA polymerase subunit alpha [Patescibacteria group bacterium]|nr:DNA-directed RNA polymerase subunit alpha [Patescibacteria group bacterium]